MLSAVSYQLGCGRCRLKSFLTAKVAKGKPRSSRRWAEELTA